MSKLLICPISHFYAKTKNIHDKKKKKKLKKKKLGTKNHFPEFIFFIFLIFFAFLFFVLLVFFLFFSFFIRINFVIFFFCTKGQKGDIVQIESSRNITNYLIVRRCKYIFLYIYIYIYIYMHIFI
jgi:hypothetical protein